MREGYKKTKVGVIPVDWEIVKQGEVATFYNGRAYKLSEWEQAGTPVIRLQNLTGSGKDFYYSNLELPDHQYCDKGDLLYMWSATFGPVWWQGDKAIFHYHIWKISHNQSKLNPVFHYFLLDVVTARMKGESHGSTMLHVTKGGMEKLNIPLPPLAEQQKIATILSTVDEKIEVIAQQITATHELKKGLMQVLLTKGIGHTEFKDSPLGKIPKSWEVVKLGEISDVLGGKRLPKGNSLTEETTSHPYVRVSDMKMGGVDLGGILYVPEDVFPAIKNYTIGKDDLFISVAGTLGIVGAIPIELDGANLTENANKITNIRVHKSFLLHMMMSPLIQDMIIRDKTNSAQPKLALARIRSFHIPKPPLDEQKQLAQVLDFYDQKLQSLTEKKSNYEALKQGLMQQLLTGNIRTI